MAKPVSELVKELDKGVGSKDAVEAYNAAKTRTEHGNGQR